MDAQAKTTAAPAAGDKPLPDYFFDGPAKLSAIPNVELDFGALTPAMLDMLATDPKRAGESFRLLPPDHRWKDATGKIQRVPVPLCEFLAYKSALAYEKETTIKQHLDAGAEKFEFFDTSGERPKIADTQGFGFYHQGIAFIIMRGSFENEDWETDFFDTMTSDVIVKDGKCRVPGAGGLKLLQLPEPDRLRELIGDAKAPGRHLGFTIAWGAVRPKIEAWIKASGFPEDMPYVFAGHSLGGALAQLGAYEFASAFHGTYARTVAAVVTFGAPTVGNILFAEDYKHRLGDQTVVIQAHADIVPVLMRRWYYRLDKTRRDLISTGLTMSTIRAPNKRFEWVGSEWKFPQQPPLSRGEFEDAITAEHRDEVRRKEEADKKQKEEKQNEAKQNEAKQKDANQQDGQSGGTSRAPEKKSGDGSAPASTASAEPQSRMTVAEKIADKKDADPIVIYLIVGVIVAILGLFVWLIARLFVRVFKKRKAAAHAIMEHYALYLSTLSYQHIRQLRAGNLAQANIDLQQYMWFIRGDSNAGGFYKDRKMRDRPLALMPKDEVATYLAHDAKTNMC